MKKWTWKREKEQKRKVTKGKGDCDECGRGERRERRKLQKTKGNCRELCWELCLLKLWLWLPMLRLNVSFYTQFLCMEGMRIGCSSSPPIFQANTISSEWNSFTDCVVVPMTLFLWTSFFFFFYYLKLQNFMK